MHHHTKHVSNKALYDNLFSHTRRFPSGVQHGRGFQLTPFMGKRHQRGYGLGNIIGGLFRSVIPLLKPVLKSVARNVGKRMLKGGINVAKNVIKGGKIKQALKREANESMSDLTSDAISYVGSKIKKQKGNTTRKKKKKRLSHGARRDIFS